MKIWTAGYGNRGYEGFVKLLHRYHVTHIVDVRSVPQSAYWEDFRLERLQRLLPESGIKFAYMGDRLGAVPNSNAACRQPDTVDFDALAHERRLGEGVDRLICAAEVPGRVVCLMCGCMRPETCHRSKLLGPQLEARGVEVVHIGADGNAMSQAEVASLWEPRQASLF